MDLRDSEEHPFLGKESKALKEKENTNARQ